MLMKLDHLNLMDHYFKHYLLCNTCMSELQDKYRFELLADEGVKKNLIKFTYGNKGDVVVFISTTKYYQIIIIPRTTCKISNDTSHICMKVRKEVESILEILKEDCGFLVCNVETNCGRYQWAFDCPSHPGEDHLCVVEIGDKNPLTMKCQKTKMWVDMEEKHSAWFTQVSS